MYLYYFCARVCACARVCVCVCGGERLCNGTDAPFHISCLLHMRVYMRMCMCMCVCLFVLMCVQQLKAALAESERTHSVALEHARAEMQRKIDALQVRHPSIFNPRPPAAAAAAAAAFVVLLFVKCVCARACL